MGFILIPPLTLIILVLGSIISGIATVNQAGAIGAEAPLLWRATDLIQNKIIQLTFPPATSHFYFNNDLRAIQFQYEYIVN